MFHPLPVRRLSMVALSVSLLLTACEGADGRKAEFMERGNTYYAQENFDKARIEYKNVLQIDPKSVAALYQLGQIDEMAQNWRAAYASYQRVIDLDESHAGARVHMGRLFLLSGDVEKASSLAEEVLAKDSNNADAMVLKAGVLARQQKQDESIALARRVLEISPGHTDATILLAGLERAKGHSDVALELLQQGVAGNPDHIGIKLVLAEALGSSGKIAEGARIMRDVIALKPSELVHRLRLAAYLEAGNDLPQAESVLRESVTMDDSQARVRLALVNFIHKHGTPEQSAAQLKEFITKDSKAYTLQFALAGERERTGHAEEALDVYKHVIDSAGGDPAGLTARARMARLLAATGKSKEAEQLIAEVLDKNVNDSEALMVRAGLALTKSDTATAVADLRNILRDQPDNLQAMKMLAQAHLLKSEQGLAIETLQKAASLSPNDAGIKLALAEVMMRQGKLDEARPLVEGVLALDATLQSALEAQFKLQMARKEWKAAEATAAVMLKAHPQQPQGDYYGGMVLAAQGNSVAAVTAYRKALAKSPDAAEPLMAIVKIELAQRKTKEALAVIDHALETNPNNFVAQNLRGEVLMLEGNAEEAEKAFAKAITINPGFAATYRNLGTARLARNDVTGAFNAYESGLKKLPDNELLFYSVAALHERQGEIDRAAQRYEELLKHKPDSEMAKNNLAMLLVTHRDDQASLNRARDLVLTLANSSEPNYLDTVGWVHYRRGEVDQALISLETALKKFPAAAQINYHIGMAYYSKGDRAAALSHLEQAVAAKSEFQGIDEARATLNKLKSS